MTSQRSSSSGSSKGVPVIRGHRPTSVCAGCQDEILDQYILRVSPDLEWHVGCLRCTHCQQALDETCTCFVRDEQPYCKHDYVRLFGARCAKCGVSFAENDLVMRARHNIYHVQCFQCVVCQRQLVAGDEFCQRGDDGLFCKADFDAVVECRADPAGTAAVTAGFTFDDNSAATTEQQLKLNNNNHGEGDAKLGMESISLPSVSSSGHSRSSGGGSSRSHKGDQKTTRVRTVLNEKQLHTLRTCYGANPRPDALMKEQLVEMTGLSPRVIRVWFQNKRCKDKKRSILMKQMQQQQEKGELCNGDDNGLWMCQKGVPMVATSPVRHEPPASLQLAPIEVHQCQQSVAPWKVLSDFALQADLDQPPFQQLVSSFGESSGEDDDDSTVVCVDEPRTQIHRRTASAQRSAVPFQPPLPPPGPQTQPLVTASPAQFSLNAHC